MTPTIASSASERRRFACIACGRCCNRGPEMELSEASTLADTFITSLLFKVHSLPTSERSGWATQWWENQSSRIPLRPALEERRRHLSLFASRRRVDKVRDRHIFLEISAIVDYDGQRRCPALRNKLCSIYEHRPLGCRTLPAHYSRAPSALRDGIDQFATTPGHDCDTGASAPVVLDGSRVVDPELCDARQRAVKLAKADRAWKTALLDVLDSQDRADTTTLSSFEVIVANSDRGFATQLPMIVAWRVARRRGMISLEEITDLCRAQLRQIEAAIADHPSVGRLRELLDLAALYRTELRQSPILLTNLDASPPSA